jgi:hypothetical protein
MELYTSYWQNYDLDGLDMVPVGISRGVPRGKKAKQLPYRYKRLPALFPSSDLLKRWIAREISPDEYTAVYRGYLDSLGLEEVTGQLKKKSAENEGSPWCSCVSACLESFVTAGYGLTGTLRRPARRSRNCRQRSVLYSNSWAPGRGPVFSNKRGFGQRSLGTAI